MLWVITVKNRRMPVDPQPATDGNLRLESRGRHLPPLAVVVTGRTDGMQLFKSHFATCPKAAEHRKVHH